MPVEAEVCEQSSRSRIERSLISLFLFCPLPLRLPYTTRHLVLDRDISDHSLYPRYLNGHGRFPFPISRSVKYLWTKCDPGCYSSPADSTDIRHPSEPSIFLWSRNICVAYLIASSLSSSSRKCVLRCTARR